MSTEMQLRALDKQNTKAIRDAGPRYAPSIDQDAPNLEIAYLNETFDAVLCQNSSLLK